MKRRLLEILACCLLVGACSAVNSYDASTSYAPTNAQRMGVYYLPKHLLHVKISGEGKNAALTVETVPVQDKRLSLETGVAFSSLSSDDVTVVFDPNGLLSQVTSSFDDKTDEIIIEIAKLAARLRNERTTTSPEFETYFDPFDYNDALAANKDLLQRGVCVEVEVQPGVWSPGCGKWSRGVSYAVHDAGWTIPSGKLMPGIYYRRAASLPVRVVRNGTTTQITPKIFANGSPIFRIDIRRTAFVKRDTTIKFTDGTLTEVKVVKPSEGLAVAQLPLQVITAVASGATGGVAGARAATLEAQANQRNADAELIKVVAGRVAAGEDVANVPVRGSVLDAGVRTSALTQEEVVSCEKMGWSHETCLTYRAE